ncbi:phage tail assembly chaperone [Clostridium neonatale]|uniref:phage tail assembly chaperone n=1 Tax=Clostridium neonatale TaxID=137838 RepID=UPI00291BBD68|nr:conserved hypothetical protein [Clostridium neonatale]
MEKDNAILQMKEEDIIAKLKGEFEMPTAKIIIEELGIPVILKGLTRKEMERERRKSIHGKKQELNNAEYDANVVIAATTNFDWGLAKPENISTTAEFLMRKLPAGVLSNLAGKVLELSGYNDELEEAEDIKNSSAEEE